MWVGGFGGVWFLVFFGEAASIEVDGAQHREEENDENSCNNSSDSTQSRPSWSTHHASCRNNT